MSGFFKKYAVLALALLAACNDKPLSLAPPQDQLYFPTGLALHKLANGRSALLVVSSNFDLHYDENTGGTLLSIDPELSLDNGIAVNPGLHVLGSVRIGSFGGELAVVDSAVDTCEGYSGAPLALVASRSNDLLYKITIDQNNGSLSCGGDCAIDLEPTPLDPYGVLPICTAQGVSVYVTYLRAPKGHGWVSRVDLAPLSLSSRNITETTFVLPLDLSDYSTDHDPTEIAPSPTGALAYDGGKRRLYLTSRNYSVNYSPMYWLDLEGTDIGDAYSGSVDLAKTMPGIYMHDLALSNDRKRAFMAIETYDPITAASSGSLVISGAALAVLDIEELAGAPQMRLVNLVPLDLGANELHVLPSREELGQRDLVAVTSSEEDSLAIYDDQSGSVAAVFTKWEHDVTPKSLPNLGRPGSPMLGRSPFGLAVDVVGTAVGNGTCRPPFGHTGGTLPESCVRIYVGSFKQNVVSVVELDPAYPEAAHYVGSFGEATP